VGAGGKRSLWGKRRGKEEKPFKPTLAQINKKRQSSGGPEVRPLLERRGDAHLGKGVASACWGDRHVVKRVHAKVTHGKQE